MSKKVVKKKSAASKGPRGPYKKKKAAKKKPTLDKNKVDINPDPEEIVKPTGSVDNFDWSNPEIRNSPRVSYDIYCRWDIRRNSSRCIISFGKYFLKNNLMFREVAFGYGAVDGKKDQLVCNFDSKSPHVRNEMLDLKVKAGNMSIVSRAVGQKLFKISNLKEPSKNGQYVKAFFRVVKVDAGLLNPNVYHIIPTRHDTNTAN